MFDTNIPGSILHIFSCNMLPVIRQRTKARQKQLISLIFVFSVIHFFVGAPIEEILRDKEAVAVHN